VKKLTANSTLDSQVDQKMYINNAQTLYAARNPPRPHDASRHSSQEMLDVTEHSMDVLTDLVYKQHGSNNSYAKC